MDGELSRFKVINTEFKNFDQFLEAIRLWNLDFRQLEAGDLYSKFVQAACPDWQICMAGFNKKLDQNGMAPEGLRTFAVVTDNTSPFTWHGKEVHKDKIMVFPEDNLLEAQTSPGFEVFTLSYHSDLLYDVMDTVGEGTLSVLDTNPYVYSCNPVRTKTVQILIHEVISEIEQNMSRMTEEQILYEIEYELPRAIILALSQESSKAKKPDPKERYWTIRRVKEYIEDFSYTDITVRDLCRAAFVSERTLRYAFNEYYGISPKAFVKMIRLNRVRQDLQRFTPEEKNISDIANRWGFWHLGQFAKDYKSLFGELPSETSR